MFGMRGKSFNVKIVNDQLVAEQDEIITRSPVENLVLAQGYAGLVKDTVADIAETVVVSISTVVLVKTTANILSLLAKKVLA